MVYLLIDDEPIILEGMEDTLRTIIGDGDEIYTAGDPVAALEIIKSRDIDIIFSDVDMPGMNGLKLADQVKEYSPDTDIIFATGFAHYSLDAWKTVAKAFILKPVTAEDMKAAIDKIVKSRVTSSVIDFGSKKRCRLEAKCFGTFELFYDGVPVHMARKKSKEMIAYLIDRRGAMISTGELRTALWDEEEDSEEKKGYIRVLANDIRKSLENIGVVGFLKNDVDYYSIDVTMISCDYFDFMDGVERARRSFAEEYMVQYPWAEITLGNLLDME